jgi:hypothetical protein
VVALYNRPDRRVWPRGKEVVLVKRVLVLATVMLVVAAMMVVMAMPALAARSAPTKQECLGVQSALKQGELSGQQKQLIRQFPNLGQCIAASEG